MKFKFWPLVFAGWLLVVAACTPLFQEEVRPVRNYSKNYFFHVVRYQGETLSLIARWYTGSVKNVTELKRQNRYIAGEDEELALKSRILIPRRLLQTMKLMPVGYVRKNSPALQVDAEPERTERPTPTTRPSRTPTRTPSPTPTETPTRTPVDTPTRTPRDTPTRTPRPLPTDEPEPEPTPVPTRTRAPRPTARGVIRAPEARRDFSEEDPAEASNPLIQIPPEIVDDLKKLAPKPTPKPVENFPAEALEPLPPIGGSEFNPEPTPVPQYEQENQYPQVEAEPTISEERKKLLDMMRGN